MYRDMVTNTIFFHFLWFFFSSNVLRCHRYTLRCFPRISVPSLYTPAFPLHFGINIITSGVSPALRCQRCFPCTSVSTVFPLRFDVDVIYSGVPSAFRCQRHTLRCFPCTSMSTLYNPVFLFHFGVNVIQSSVLYNGLSLAFRCQRYTLRCFPALCCYLFTFSLLLVLCCLYHDVHSLYFPLLLLVLLLRFTQWVLMLLFKVTSCSVLLFYPILFLWWFVPAVFFRGVLTSPVPVNDYLSGCLYVLTFWIKFQFYEGVVYC